MNAMIYAYAIWNKVTILKKVAFLTLFTIGFINCQDLNLVMLIGCENLDSTKEALHANFTSGIENEFSIPNLAILASQATLTGFIKECEKNCTDIENRFQFDQNWKIYLVPNSTPQKYYLFVRTEDLGKFQDILEIKGNAIPFKQISKLDDCDHYTNTQYFRTLADNLFKKNKDSKSKVNIYLNGHGSPLPKEAYLNALKLLPTALGIEISQKIPAIISSTGSAQLGAMSRWPNFAIIKFLKEFDIDADDDNIKMIKDFISLLGVSSDALIANMAIPDFNQFLKFLNNYVNVRYLYIDTCYGGGLNSILAYNTDIKFNFDIVNSSSTGSLVYATKDNFRLFKILVDLQTKFGIKSKLENQSSQFIRLFKWYSPMIRPKNQTTWFPLFKNIQTENVNTFDITKVLVDKKVAEKNNFVFQGNNQTIFVTTPCIKAPVYLSFDSIDSIQSALFVLRPTQILFEELRITGDNIPENYFYNNFLVDEILRIFYGRSYFGEIILDIKDIINTIFIKKFIIADKVRNKILKNVYIKRTADDSLKFTYESDSKFYEIVVTSTEFAVLGQPIEIDSYLANPEIQQIIKQCQNYGTNLTPIIKHLEEKKAGKLPITQKTVDVSSVIQECLARA